MLVKHGDKNIVVQFQHVRAEESRRRRNNGHTVCSVHFDVPDVKKLDECSATATGTAKVYRKDQFCKETGRKIALTNALLNLSNVAPSLVDKTVRTTIWQAYFGRKPKKKVADAQNDSGNCCSEGVSCR